MSPDTLGQPAHSRQEHCPGQTSQQIAISIRRAAVVARVHAGCMPLSDHDEGQRRRVDLAGVCRVRELCAGGQNLHAQGACHGRLARHRSHARRRMAGLSWGCLNIESCPPIAVYASNLLLTAGQPASRNAHGGMPSHTKVENAAYKLSPLSLTCVPCEGQSWPGRSAGQSIMHVSEIGRYGRTVYCCEWAPEEFLWTAPQPALPR